MVRWALMFVAGVTFMAVRLSVHGNVKVKPWTRMENRFAHMPPVRHAHVPLAATRGDMRSPWCVTLVGGALQGMPRMLSVAYSHVLYAWVMLCPWRLSFEWGLGSSPLFHTWFEYRSLWVAGVYSAAAAVLGHCLRQHKFAALWGLAWAFASWLPSSNILVYVGTEYAERLMYLPSLGLILGVACCLPKDVDLACDAGSSGGGGSSADVGASGGGGGGAGKSATHRCCKHAHPNYVLVAGIALLAIAANAARTVCYNRAWANECVAGCLQPTHVFTPPMSMCSPQRRPHVCVLLSPAGTACSALGWTRIRLPCEPPTTTRLCLPVGPMPRYVWLCACVAVAVAVCAAAAGWVALICSLTILVVRVGQRIQAWHYNLRALAVLPDYPGPQLNLALLYRDTFHRKDLAYIHFRECVYGRRLLTSVQECHQSQAELLLERCMRACVLP